MCIALSKQCSGCEKSTGFTQIQMIHTCISQQLCYHHLQNAENYFCAFKKILKKGQMLFLLSQYSPLFVSQQNVSLNNGPWEGKKSYHPPCLKTLQTLLYYSIESRCVKWQRNSIHWHSEKAANEHCGSSCPLQGGAVKYGLECSQRAFFFFHQRVCNALYTWLWWWILKRERHCLFYVTDC